MTSHNTAVMNIKIKVIESHASGHKQIIVGALQFSISLWCSGQVAWFILKFYLLLKVLTTAVNRIPHLDHIVFCFVLFWQWKSQVSPNTIPKRNVMTKASILSFSEYLLRASQEPVSFGGVWGYNNEKHRKKSLCLWNLHSSGRKFISQMSK